MKLRDGLSMEIPGMLAKSSDIHAEAAQLQVRWFDAWHGSLDDALAVLPEMETCPHELYRMLAVNPGPAKKRIALVTHAGDPVAVAALRARGRHWETVTKDVTLTGSAELAPAVGGLLVPALGSLGVDLWISGLPELPNTRSLRSAAAVANYGIGLDIDYEAFWRKTGHLKTVRQARNKTLAMRLKVDEPGALDWMLQGHAKRWGVAVSDSLGDRILAARYLADRGLYRWLSLQEGDQFTAAHSLLKYRGDVISQVTHRLMTYENAKVGTRIFDLSFQWAADAGYQRMDLSGGPSYKARWAPEDGIRWRVNLCPRIAYELKRAGRALRSAASNAALRNRPT